MKPNLQLVPPAADPIDFIGVVKRAIAVDEARSRHLAHIIRAAIGVLQDMITEAECGFHPERVLRAASAELEIPHLIDALRTAITLIPLPPDSPEIQRIESAIRSAESHIVPAPT